MKMRSISMGFVFSITTLMALGLMPRVSFAVNLLESNVWSSVTVSNGVSGQVNDFADIDLDDNANLLVVALPGECADVTNATFGGVAMTLAVSRNESYARSRFYTLFDPSTESGQTLRLVSMNNSGIDRGGYSPQIFVFSNVESISDTPGAGRGNAGAVTLDFGSASSGSYLLITASVNGSSIAFQAPATDLVGLINGTGSGWKARTAGETISADAAGKTVDVTTDNRVTTIGLELLPLPLAPAGTMFKFQ